ncbi:MAG: flagellar basal body P-ring protein FlgI [Aeoliella sp.]
MNERASLLPYSCTALLGLMLASAGSIGCMSILTRGGAEKATLEELAHDSPDLVGTFTHPYGMNYVKIEAISLVTGLNGTGEDPPPTPQRASLIADMKRRQVKDANKVLASPDTSLVLVRGVLRPGIQEGDQFDIEVRVPSRGESTSLRGGWLLPARLTELAVLGQQIRRGHVLGIAEGAILVDPHAQGEEGEPYSTRGRVLGGGVAAKSRSMGLVIDDRHKSVRLAQQIAKSVNVRFHLRVDGRKDGVATPKTDEFIELSVHARYKDNVGRYMQVVRSVAVGETARQRQARLAMLAEQIKDPLTAASAALQLEALGDDQAVESLQRALESSDTEVRFYAAEALAYLDKTSAVDVLTEMARNERAFRVNSMAALSAMDDLSAFESLRGLLAEKSAETRYGAFRSLWAMNPHDALVAGEDLGGMFSFHQLDVDGPPMIHLTNSHRPEIVLFGAQPPLKLPVLIEAGNGILINGMQGRELTVSRFANRGEAEQRTIPPNVSELVRTLVDFGGSYPDVVQALQQAKEQGSLEPRLTVDALPQAGRLFRRDDAATAQEEGDRSFDVATPLPDLFKRRT